MQSIIKFNTDTFINALKAFFEELKVPVDYLADEPASPADILGERFKENNEAHKLIADVYALGMVNDAIFDGTETFKNLADLKKIITKDYDGLLIFGVTLSPPLRGGREGLPSRSHLAEITRAFNRTFPYTPVTIIFKYNNLISLANSERIKYKQERREGEKAGKVSVLRDVNIQNPHRGHLEILKELEIQTSGKNAVNSFASLYKYWQEVFSVSILNKKFYKELQNWYFWAIKEVTFPNTPNRFDFESDEKFDEAVKEHKGKNVIRLLTRILFIWFIKEKGLIPEQLFDEKAIADKLIKDFTPQKPQGVFATGKNNSPYYRAILQNLFFATLNQEMGKRAFRIDGKNQNVTNLMRYKSYFKDPEYFVQLMEEVVPFMNGGLFECLDKPHESAKGKQGGDIIIYNDGFSDRMDNDLVVPDYLFFDVDEEVDLSDDFGNKVFKNSKTRGLLEILQSYKFTITENTPIEEDVALDPELLGKVFENLLASYNPETKTTARKQTGSFYTPREIVNYMVDESLIAYLKNCLNHNSKGLKDLRDAKNQGNQENPTNQGSDNVLDTMLHHLLSYDTINPFKDNTDIQKQIIKALDQCTILDPACGSGAFPMGILQKMVHVLHKIDPKNTEWEQRQIDRVNKAIESLEEIDDVRFREQSIKELKTQIKDIEDSFENNELDYGRKLYLIENCIYGVDIQSIATQISKLRFFISLIVDQKIDKAKENFGIRPLPNLETKFVAANTLIGIEKPKAQLNLFENQEIKKLEAELKKVRHKLFSSKSPSNKRKLREDDKELRNRIADLLVNDGWENKTARQLASWDPYDQNESSPFFDKEWMFDISNGFDIVIGNPPYIKEYTNKDAFEGLRTSPYYQGKMDLWYLFACKNLDNLKKKTGVLCFIATNNWTTNAGASKMRAKILNESTIHFILDFGSYMIFESADIQTMVMLLRNDNTNNNYNFELRRLVGNGIVFNDVLDLILNKRTDKVEYLTPVISKENIKDMSLTFSNDMSENILVKIKSKENFIIDPQKEIAQGIVPNPDVVNNKNISKIPKSRVEKENIKVGDGVFIINKGYFNLLSLNESKYIKPIYEPYLIGKYSVVNYDKEIIYITKKNFKNDAPKLMSHLEKFKEIMEDRRENQQGKLAFNHLHWPRVEYFFEQGAKILSVRKCAVPTFSYTEAEAYVMMSFNVIRSKRIDLKYLTAILNSKLIAFWLRYKGKMQGNNYQLDKEPLLQIPIFKTKEVKPITTIVDQILNKKEEKPQANTTILERQLDEMVFKLYELTYEEVKVVAPDFWLSEAEYAAVEID